VKYAVVEQALSPANEFLHRFRGSDPPLLTTAWED
jgi:hypothetical protein